MQDITKNQSTLNLRVKWISVISAYSGRRIMQKVSAVILAGGKSNRMGGNDKVLLTHGGRTFLDHLIHELQGFSEILLSVDRADRYTDTGFTVITDTHGGCGPVSGLCTALKICRYDSLFVVAGDMPLFSADFAGFLLNRETAEDDAVIPVTRDGRFHPLCGLYKKRTYEVFQRCMERGQYRIGTIFPQLNVRKVFLAETAYPDEILFNINTLEDYAHLKGLGVEAALA